MDNCFSFDDLLLLDEHDEKEYVEDKQGISNVHWGQRKLLLSEILFLTKFYDCNVIPNPVIVYAGASPGNHIPFLSQLFPLLTFHLYDPQPFHIQSTEKIFIHQQLFTLSQANQWSGRLNVYFISDIRTADAEKQKLEDHEQTIIKDMQLQASWYKTIKPVQALLKFRLPYPIAFLPLSFNYLDGWIFKQPWAPARSTETRLVPNNKMKIWQTKKYESQMFYHNTMIRTEQKYQNAILDEQELVNDFDSCGETNILSQYYKKCGLEANDEQIKQLSRLITIKLNSGKKDEYNLEKLRANPNLIKERAKQSIAKREQIVQKQKESRNGQIDKTYKQAVINKG